MKKCMHRIGSGHCSLPLDHNGEHREALFTSTLADVLLELRAAPASDRMASLLTEILIRIDRVEMKIDGVCPTCLVKVAQVLPGGHGFAPGLAANLIAKDIDPTTGHRFGCEDVTR